MVYFAPEPPEKIRDLSAMADFSQLSVPVPNPNPNSPISCLTKEEEEEDGHSSAITEPAETSEPDYEPASASVSESELIHVSFNQDYSCFAAGTTNGFRIFNCDPFREIFRRDFDAGGGIGEVAMLFRCNILALVGGGSRPRFPLNKVMIWDDHQSRCISDLAFRSEVRSVRLLRDRIVVVLDRRVLVYNFADLRQVHQIETAPNAGGLCAVSQQQGMLILACPGPQKGQLRVEHYSTKKITFITAHDSRLACFVLSRDGRLVATASTKGTLIRVFGTADGVLLQEVRRGADRAEIYSLAFSENMQWLAVSSDKGTVHVFSLKIDLGLTVKDKPLPAPNTNVPATASSLSFIKGVLPKYFHSEWSVAQYRLREGSKCVVAFGHKKNTIVILGMDGSFYRCEYDPVAGGEMTQLECWNFLKPNETFH